MKRIVVIVKPFRAQAVLESIADLTVGAALIGEAKGYGRQKDRLPLYRGSEFDHVYLPKIEITFFVEDELKETAIERIISSARTGRIGDGKIFISPVLASFEYE